MKKLSIAVWCFSLLYADLSVHQIEKMVEKIHLKREGVALKTLEQTEEPFIQVKEENNVTVMALPEPESEDVTLLLHALMIDKAYINDGWKKVDDVVMGYTVKYIGKRGVVLRNGNKIKTLFLGKPKDDLIRIEERE